MKKGTALKIFLMMAILWTIVVPKHKVEAASTVNTNELLLFSHMVYSPIDGFGGSTGKMLNQLDWSTYPGSKFKNDFADSYVKVYSYACYCYQTVHVEGPVITRDSYSSFNSAFTKNNLQNWFIYDFLDGKDGKDAKSKGMFGVIFKNKVTGDFVVAFRGSSDPDDWLGADVSIGKGKDPEQLEYAKKLLYKLPSTVSKDKIVLTGHSLGGWLAERLGAGIGYKTVTFNAPGFTKEHYNQLKKEGKINYASMVTNYRVDGDKVSSSLLGVDVSTHAGSIVTKSTTKYTTKSTGLGNHPLVNFYDYFTTK